jgi:P27 family predicted phage terminase small subunit
MRIKKAPDHLSKEAKEMWEGVLTEYKIEDVAGLKILQASLEAWDRAQASREVIDLEGMQVKDRFKQMKAHPLITVERDARSQFLQGLKALNLDLEPIKNIGRPPGR